MQNSTEEYGFSELDTTIGICTVLYAIATIIGNILIIQIIRNQRRKCVSDFVFAQTSLVHIFGGFTAFLCALILMSGREMFNVLSVDDLIRWFGGFIWHLVALLTPMLLVLAVAGRAVMDFCPLRYEAIVNIKSVIAASILCWIWSLGVLAPFIYKGFNIEVLERWGYPHHEISATNYLERYLMILCFAGPFLLLQLVLISMILSILVKHKLFKRKEKKKEHKSFIQAGLRNILAQTMVPLPTVFEGAEVGTPVPTTELQEPSCTATASPSSQELEQMKEIYRWMDESARVLASSSSTYNIQSDSCVSWSAVSTPVSVRALNANGQCSRQLQHCPPSLQSSTYSLGLIRADMRSVLDTITRAASATSSPLQGRAGAAVLARNKETQIKMLSLHLSYSFLLSHFMVTVYCFSCILHRDLGLFSQTRHLSTALVYLKGCYYASVFLNSGLTPVIFWTFHHNYRQMVSFYVYKLRVILVLFCRKYCRCAMPGQT